MDDRMLTTQKVARQLGVSTHTIRRWVKEGRLHGTKYFGGKLDAKMMFFKKSEIDAISGMIEPPVAGETPVPAPAPAETKKDAERDALAALVKASNLPEETVRRVMAGLMGEPSGWEQKPERKSKAQGWGRLGLQRGSVVDMTITGPGGLVVKQRGYLLRVRGYTMVIARRPISQHERIYAARLTGPARGVSAMRGTANALLAEADKREAQEAANGAST